MSIAQTQDLKCTCHRFLGMNNCLVHGLSNPGGLPPILDQIGPAPREKASRPYSDEADKNYAENSADYLRGFMAGQTRGYNDAIALMKLFVGSK